MSSSNRRKLHRNTVAVNVGCGCRSYKLSDIFHPKQKITTTSTHQNPHLHISSSSNITFSPNFQDPKSSKTLIEFGRIGESVAVVKQSDDPYLDFRNSMLQMILEKEIYGRDDLRHLLDCFLSLNSPYHHAIIVRAFTEIWNGLFDSSKPRVGPTSREL